MKIALGLYTGNYTLSSYGPNLLSIADDLFSHDMYGGFAWSKSCRVDSNRNKIINAFLKETDADYLFILDEDMIHPPQMPRLLARHKKDIVSGLYFARDESGVEHKPQLYKMVGEGPDDRPGYGKHVNIAYRAMADEVYRYFAQFPKVPALDGPLVLTKNDGGDPVTDSLIEIDAGGFGCVLLARTALEQLDPPYLHDELGLNGDLAFYKKAKKTGLAVYADLGVIATHLQTVPIGLYGFYRFSQDIRSKVEKSGLL